MTSEQLPSFFRGLPPRGGWALAVVPDTPTPIVGGAMVGSEKETRDTDSQAPVFDLQEATSRRSRGQQALIVAATLSCLTLASLVLGAGVLTMTEAQFTHASAATVKAAPVAVNPELCDALNALTAAGGGPEISRNSSPQVLAAVDELPTITGPNRNAYRDYVTFLRASVTKAANLDASALLSDFSDAYTRDTTACVPS